MILKALASEHLRPDELARFRRELESTMFQDVFLMIQDTFFWSIRS